MISRTIYNFKKFQELKDATIKCIQDTAPGKTPVSPVKGMEVTYLDTLIPEVSGTIFEELILSVPTKVCKIRIVKVNGNTVCQIPPETDPMIYVPIISHKNNGFLFPEEDYMRTLQATGNILWIDTTRNYTFINWGIDPVINLVMSIVDKDYIPALKIGH